MILEEFPVLKRQQQSGRVIPLRGCTGVAQEPQGGSSIQQEEILIQEMSIGKVLP